MFYIILLILSYLLGGVTMILIEAGGKDEE